MKYHVCVIWKGDKNVSVKNLLLHIRRMAKVKAIAFDKTPVKHVHLLVHARKKINYRYFNRFGVYVKFIPIRTHTHYINVIKYIHGHKYVLGGENVKKDEFVRYVMEKLEVIEREIKELKMSREQGNANSVEVNLSRMNVKLQPAKKGLAMRIRFARYVKPNNKGEYYVILTKEDYNRFITALQSVKFPELNESTESKGNNVKVEKGGELG